MKIFISYPRKLIEKAELLSGRLYNMRQKHFIDHEIDPGKSWDKEIKEKIQEHDIYIILFENSDLDPNGYYLKDELGAIKRELTENPFKRAIPVIFHPSLPEDMPVFYRGIQGINVEENSNYWL